MPLSIPEIMENIIFAAHPDDEIIWFSSLIGMKDTLLVICFDTIPFDKQQENLEHTDKFTKILKEYQKNILVIWLKTPKVVSPRIFGKVDNRVVEILKENIKTILNTLNPKKVYTHNPWGEYGHSEHIILHNILKEMRKDIIFPSIALDKANERNEYTQNIYFIKPVCTNRVDKIFQNRMIQKYKDSNIWTMKEGINFLFDTEEFKKYSK